MAVGCWAGPLVVAPAGAVALGGGGLPSLLAVGLLAWALLSGWVLAWLPWLWPLVGARLLLALALLVALGVLGGCWLRALAGAGRLLVLPLLVALGAWGDCWFRALAGAGRLVWGRAPGFGSLAGWLACWDEGEGPSRVLAGPGGSMWARGWEGSSGADPSLGLGPPTYPGGWPPMPVTSHPARVWVARVVCLVAWWCLVVGWVCLSVFGTTGTCSRAVQSGKGSCHPGCNCAAGPDDPSLVD